MPCPTCQNPLQKQELDGQQVLHCTNCGSTFFDENSINRLSIKSAERLASDKKHEINPSAQIPCPRDNIFLLPMAEESIPPHVKLFQCEMCKGIFGGPEDIVNFKKAQDAKINYFKVWQLPLPALRSVLVLSLIALMSFGLVLTTSQLDNRSLTSTQATDVISTISASESNQYLILTFKTTVPVKSRVTLVEQATGNTINKNISNSFTTIHQMATSELDLSKKYLIKITLTDKQNKTISTELQPLVIE